MRVCVCILRENMRLRTCVNTREKLGVSKTMTYVCMHMQERERGVIIISIVHTYMHYTSYSHMQFEDDIYIYIYMLRVHKRFRCTSMHACMHVYDLYPILNPIFIYIYIYINFVLY